MQNHAYHQHALALLTLPAEVAHVQVWHCWHHHLLPEKEVLLLQVLPLLLLVSHQRWHQLCTCNGLTVAAALVQ
jgi:hypothetical protein